MDIQHISLNMYPIDESETHYAFHTLGNSLYSPHDHDFYEILLVLSGSMNYQLCGKNFVLAEGSLAFMRPGDSHCKISNGSPCQHINVAFPDTVVNALCDFLYDNSKKEVLMSFEYLPIITLSSNDTKMLRQKLEMLNLLPVNRKMLCRMHLRMILLDIISQHYSEYFLDSYSIAARLNLPTWLDELLNSMRNPDTFSYTLEDWAEFSQKTKEYLCRSFRKYLNTTPMQHLNSLHLNYAANLLAHTDIEIIDVAYDSGFQSLSHFYHLFKEEFNSSPSKYRIKCQRKDLSK